MAIFPTIINRDWYFHLFRSQYCHGGIILWSHKGFINIPCRSSGIFSILSPFVFCTNVDFYFASPDQPRFNRNLDENRDFKDMWVFRSMFFYLVFFVGVFLFARDLLCSRDLAELVTLASLEVLTSIDIIFKVLYLHIFKVHWEMLFFNFRVSLVVTWNLTNWMLIVIGRDRNASHQLTLSARSFPTSWKFDLLGYETVMRPISVINDKDCTWNLVAKSDPTFGTTIINYVVIDLTLSCNESPPVLRPGEVFFYMLKFIVICGDFTSLLGGCRAGRTR